jgi:acetyltransferase
MYNKTMMVTFITEITPEFTEKFTQLANHVIDEIHSTGFIEKVTYEETKELLDQVVKKRGSAIAAIFDEDKNLQATGLLTPAHQKTSKHYCEISKVMVAPHTRRRGLGSNIMEALEAKAKELGYTHVMIDTWDISFILEFCELCGYTKIGKIPNYVHYKDQIYDSYLMFKIL